MSSTEKLLQATLNRLRVRISQNFINAAVELAVIAKEAPEKLQKEWELFQEEVINEANKLENECAEENIKKSDGEEANLRIENPKYKIAQLRKKVAELSEKLEAKY